MFVVGVVVAIPENDDVSPDASDVVAQPGRCDDNDQDNSINKQVRLTTSDEWIEFELWSIEEFPVRALFPVVRIGSRDFSRSRYPDDGRLNSLIFFIPPEELDLLTPDDQVWIYYGGAGGPPPLNVMPDDSDPWSFGSFNMGLLDCTATEET